MLITSSFNIMKHLGHIELRDGKVVFVYYESPEPKKLINTTSFIAARRYVLALRKYLASKREVEVSNVFWEFVSRKWRFDIEDFYPMYEKKYVKHNQPCEAEVTDNKATIVKIL